MRIPFFDSKVSLPVIPEIYAKQIAEYTQAKEAHIQTRIRRFLEKMWYRLVVVPFRVAYYGLFLFCLFYTARDLAPAYERYVFHVHDAAVAFAFPSEVPVAQVVEKPPAKEVRRGGGKKPQPKQPPKRMAKADPIGERLRLAE
jgi:hypothetical protein